MTDNKKEQVNHPSHYGGESNNYEAIKVIEAWGLGFCLGNTVKYISRAGKKETDKTIQDLKKAKWYLDREIAKLESIDGLIQKYNDVDYKKYHSSKVAEAWNLGLYLENVISLISTAGKNIQDLKKASCSLDCEIANFESKN